MLVWQISFSKMFKIPTTIHILYIVTQSYMCQCDIHFDRNTRLALFNILSIPICIERNMLKSNYIYTQILITNFSARWCYCLL